MRHRTTAHRAARIAAGIALVVAILAAPTARAQEYEAIDLGAIPGGYSIANGINNLGHVVGQARWPSTTGNHPYYFDGVTMHDLGTNGGNSGDAEACNDSGWVVGGAGGFQKPYLWTAVGGMTILPTLGGDFGRAHGINGLGDIVGRASIAGNGEQHAVVWPAAGGQIDLGMLPGDECSFAIGTDINDSGVVVGFSEMWSEEWQGYPYRAFRWTAATGMEDLGTLGGPGSEAFAINASGMIVGDADLADGSWHAFMFDGTTMHDLGTLSEGETYYSVAYDVNNKGQVVGYSDMDDGRYHGVLWQNGQMIDLDTLLPDPDTWHIDFAYGINEDGWIACRGSTPRSPGTATAAILLRPVPETPTTMWVRTTSGEPGRPVQLCGVLRRASDGTRIAGKTLNFDVNGWQTSGVTNAQGAVYVNYPVPAAITIGSELTITVGFDDAADPDYATCSGTGTLTIGKSSTSMWVRSQNGEPGQTLQLAAVLMRARDGARVAGRTLNFTVGDWQGSGVTNAQGAVYINYQVPGTALPGGTPLAVNVTFTDANDPEYKPCSGSGSITVVRARTWVWVRTLSGAQGQTAQLCGVLMRTSDGARVAGRTLNFNVDGWQTSGVTNAGGAVYVNYPIPAGAALGAHTITVSFTDGSDPVYLTSSGTGTLTVTP